MPTLSFLVTQPVYDVISNAITGYNAYNPQAEPLIDENDFAKRAFQMSLVSNLRRLRDTRVSSLGDKLGTCSNDIWNQITGLLG